MKMNSPIFLVLFKKFLFKAIVLLSIFLFFNSFSIPFKKTTPKFDLSNEERIWLEKFFRYFMFHESAIYTLFGSKPITEFPIIYYPEDEELQNQDHQERGYFFLNRDNKEDLQFYKTLTKKEKQKAYLFSEKDYIYDFNDLWERWEKIQHRFPLKKSFLLLKKERTLSEEDKKDYAAIYDISFVNILNTASVIQENYELFKQTIGFDFDALKVVFELENEKTSDFWNKLHEMNPCKSSPLWGLLYGFGRKNAFGYLWKWRNIKDEYALEKVFGQTIDQRSSNKQKWPHCTGPSAYSITKFPIPTFSSYSENDPIIAKYETEREKIKQLYKGKDFVDFTLELLTQD